MSALRDYYTKSHTSSSYELGVAFASKADLSAVPSKVSELANDAGYITSADISSKADISSLQSYLPLSGGVISGILGVTGYSQFHGAVDTPQANFTISSDEDAYNSIRASSATELEIRGNYGATAASLPIKAGTIAYVADIEQQVSSKADISALDESQATCKTKSVSFRQAHTHADGG